LQLVRLVGCGLMQAGGNKWCKQRHGETHLKIFPINMPRKWNWKKHHRRCHKSYASRQQYNRRAI